MDAVLRILRWAIILGGIGFIAGFFGPMILAPGANQGPMLGIFITGPLGAIAGAAYGIWHELRGTGGTANDAAAGWVRPALRGGAMFLAVVFVINGIGALAFGGIIGGVIAIAIGAVLGWWGWKGRWSGMKR
jgi:hypothetical protein